MTTKIARPYKRRATLMGVAIAALLSPSGKIISSALAGAVLVGGIAIHQHKPSPPAKQASTATSKTHTHLADVGPFNAVFTSIEVEGREIPVMLSAGSAASGSHSEPGFSSVLPLTGMPFGETHNSDAGSPRFGRHSGSTTPPPGPRTAEPGPSNPQSDLPPVGENNPPLLPDTKPANCRDEEKLTGQCVATQSDSSADEKPDTELSNPLDDTQSADPGNPPANDHGEGGKGGAPTEQPDWPPEDTDSLLPSEQPLQPISEISEPEQVSPTAVPEPSMIALMLLGLAAMAWTARRQIPN